MKNFLTFPIFVAICCLIFASAPATTKTTSAAAKSAVDNLSPATRLELARARNATARFHDFDNAEDYEFLHCVPGEGLEYVNWSIVDCNFDIEHPEALHYIEEGDGLQLVGCEELVAVADRATAQTRLTV